MGIGNVYCEVPIVTNQAGHKDGQDGGRGFLCSRAGRYGNLVRFITRRPIVINVNTLLLCFEKDVSGSKCKRTFLFG